MGVVCVFLYGASFLTVQFFPVLMEWFNAQFNNMAGIYWVFAIICMACVLFSWKLIPETKGLSLEKISEFWDNDNLVNQK